MAHDVEGAIAPTTSGVLSRQSGVIARWQLRRLGATRDAIKHALAAGRLVAVHRGVYAAGRAELSERGRIVAALLAAGPHSVASHWTAAFLYELIPTLPAVIDVTTLGRGRRSRPGLKIHETTRLFEIRRRRGIPLTSPLRTLTDLPAAAAHRLTTEALVRRLIAPHEVPDRAPTRSPLEDRAQEFDRVGGDTDVDLRLWEARLPDHRQEQVEQEPDKVIAAIAAALTRRAAA